ncbi:hypothetical protein IE53DRAFT_339797 [Violaceomyces palustris]|uniref:Uncharacterized protein n=1 Tax=Violaceomyces palustris TaxID=1673888 RepID=A0ACD0P4H8_9BASI|nr:hypothetical protein IE53DRAFT_339797 [Violaceomyces palustris]
MYEPRVVQQHFPPLPLLNNHYNQEQFDEATSGAQQTRRSLIIRPSGRPGHNAPKAATLFLGKDHERWMRHDRDRLGFGLGWRAVASSVSSSGGDHRGSYSHGTLSSESSGSEDDDSDFAPSLSSRSSFRSRSSRHSHGKRSRRPSEAFTPPMTPSDAKPIRERRFSSNGPEAAFLRHETVIGIHTPRRGSSASSDGFPILKPLAQIRPPSGVPSAVALPPGTTSPDAGDSQKSSDNEKHPVKKERVTKVKESPSLLRLRSNLALAAAAAAASNDEAPLIDGLEDDGSIDVSKLVEAIDVEGELDVKKPLHVGLPTARSVSPRAPPLKLARRKKPEKVEGTLYDRSGPHREGAVTDGLSVRLFSSGDGVESTSRSHQNGQAALQTPANDEDALYMRSTAKRARSATDSQIGANDRCHGQGSCEAEGQLEEGDAQYHTSRPTVYLITTPDNRVSSAAKLRRWAMDGDGNFYAAMEIKTVDAKLKAADPSSGPATKELARELKETYLEDILDEVQKAETLNPNRSGTISKVLRTEDKRYIRLEEDYPEEAFFVIAGCEEEELYPVVVTVFNQAIRALARFHAAGWMHGDVKLENLMFDQNGKLVVIDYENANPYRGVPGGDGMVQLVSYDWTSPEAILGPNGRRMGPSGDLWALGCNMIRAFALRDGVDDLAIREMLLGEGQNTFLDFAEGLVQEDQDYVHKPATGLRKGSVQYYPEGVDLAPPPSRYKVDLESIIEDAKKREEEEEEVVVVERSKLPQHPRESVSAVTNDPMTAASPPSIQPQPCSNPTPERLLHRFALEAPELLSFILSRCVVRNVARRGTEAEIEGLRLAEWFEKSRSHLLQIGQSAVKTAIELSGSAWVKPKLDEARRSLGLA